MPADALVIVVCPDRDPHVGAWARAYHRRAPLAGLVAMMHDVDPATVSRALAGGARSVLVTPLSVEAIRQAVADVEDWVGRIASIPVGQAVAAPGRRTVIVGSKGGSGVTTIVSQLAYRLLPSRVTVVDLERLAPALADQLGVTLRQDLFELARVAPTMSTRQLADAGAIHSSGLRVFAGTAPRPGGDRLTGIGAIDPGAPTGSSALRCLFDLVAESADHVVIDGGRGMSPEAEFAVSSADQVVVVVTPDVASLRSGRRLLDRWEDGGVRRSSDCRVLVNRTDRNSEIRRPVISRVLAATSLRTELPADYRRLEAIANGSAGGPDAGVVGGRIGSAFDDLATELGAAPPVRRRWLGGRRDAGQSSIELVAVIGLLMIGLLGLGQVLGLGVAVTEVERAAGQGARASVLAAAEPTADRRTVTAAAERAVGRETGDQDSAISVVVARETVTVRVRRRAPRLVPGPGIPFVSASVTVRRP